MGRDTGKEALQVSNWATGQMFMPFREGYNAREISFQGMKRCKLITSSVTNLVILRCQEGKHMRRVSSTQEHIGSSPASLRNLRDTVLWTRIKVS